MEFLIDIKLKRIMMENKLIYLLVQIIILDIELNIYNH